MLGTVKVLIKKLPLVLLLNHVCQEKAMLNIKKWIAVRLSGTNHIGCTEYSFRGKE